MKNNCAIDSCDIEPSFYVWTHEKTAIMCGLHTAQANKIAEGFGYEIDILRIDENSQLDLFMFSAKHSLTTIG